jgi:iron(III) transport system permease protein
MLAGPNAGFLNAAWRWLTGADEALVNIFSMAGLIFVVSLYTFPYVYILIANTLALIASDLEEAAAILGGGRLIVALTITVPLVAPAIVSGFILSVLQALALFGSPAILALPAGFHTVTTQIWAFFHFPPKVEMAAAFSIPLLLATALLLLVQKKLLGRRGYAAVGGKGGQRRIIALWRAGQGGPVARLGPAAHLGEPHPGQFFLHVLRVRCHPVGDPQHPRAGCADGVRG